MVRMRGERQYAAFKVFWGIYHVFSDPWHTVHILVSSSLLFRFLNVLSSITFQTILLAFSHSNSSHLRFQGFCWTCC
jgi:hypothetical protein